MSMQIVTGYEGQAHVTAWQDRDLNQGIFGNGTYILNVGSKLAATIVSNNQVDIADGAVMLQGCLGVIQKGTSESLTIDNGSQGVMRRDLICAQYSKDTSTGVESMSLVVIKGTPAASNPTDPAYTTGDIQNGDALVQVPLYRVILNGLSVTSVDRLIDEAGNLSEGSGTTNTLSGSKSIPSNSGTWTSYYTALTSVLMPAGTYIVTLHAGIEESTPVYTRISDGTSIFSGATGANSEYDHQSNATALINLSSPTMVVFYARQESGGSTVCTYDITYKKVG